jgi:hypothetical protein
VSYEVTQAELEQHLIEQMSFMRRSARDFDAGDESEAKRLALYIRTLVYDSRNSKSLLGQLGLKDSIRFEDTTIRHVELPPGFTELPPGSIVLDSGITVTRMKFGGLDAGVAFAAPLDDVAPERIGPPVEFEQWWEPVILTDMQGCVQPQVLRPCARERIPTADSAYDS